MEPDRQVEARSHRLWAIVVLLGTALLFFLGGGVGALRGPERLDISTLQIPVLLEPVAGELPTPPTKFRWTPGHPDAVAQVVLHRQDYVPLWSSQPLSGVSELEIPREVWEGRPAGRTFLWRVREALGGKPLGSSAYVEFTFRRDWMGFAEGKLPPQLLKLDD